MTSTIRISNFLLATHLFTLRYTNCVIYPIASHKFSICDQIVKNDKQWSNIIDIRHCLNLHY